jgi:predicted phage terminase large subunit-like protein
MKDDQTPEQFTKLVAGLREASKHATSDTEVRDLINRIATVTRNYRIQHGIGIPTNPAMQAQELDSDYVIRPHTKFLSDRLANAVHDVERGKNRMLAVSMPPRAGKSTLLSLYSPLWMLRRHPEWKIITASYDGALTGGWARTTRRLIEDKPDLGISLERDGGAGTQWSTLEGGGLFSASVRGALTGRGARVLIIDDPVKDFVEAHSLATRSALWDWWLSVALTRLEPPYLVLVVMTRWHEDDFIGRLLSTDFEGDPRAWEKISLPAIADTKDDPLKRVEGEPLYSPLIEETADQAINRWSDVKRTVGTYTFSAMYQQRPAPAKGAIFDSSWWRFWTTYEGRETDDGRVVWLNPENIVGGQWLDSWDMSFKGVSDSDWVVGQRWVRLRANRYLIAQVRGRWSFTQSIAAMQRWSSTSDSIMSPCGHLVHERLVEEKANGPAIIDTLKTEIPGIKPINPVTGKEARARAITPEAESGNVYLPHPADPGNGWVTDLLSELRNFPHDSSDDQVDALTQALTRLRTGGRGQVTVPGSSTVIGPAGGWSAALANRNITQTAKTDLSRRRATR